MNTPSEIIRQWPSTEQFASDIGLKSASHARTMLARNSINSKYWHRIAEAAKTRGIPDVDLEALAQAHAKRARQ